MSFGGTQPDTLYALKSVIGLGSTGTLAAAGVSFSFGPAAETGNPTILYTHGDVYWNPDGTGPQLPVLLAHVNGISADNTSKRAGSCPIPPGPWRALVVLGPCCCLPRTRPIDALERPSQSWTARLPLHPRLSRLVVESAQRGFVAEGCAVAAALSEQRQTGDVLELRAREPRLVQQLRHVAPENGVRRARNCQSHCCVGRDDWGCGHANRSVGCAVDRGGDN